MRLVGEPAFLDDILRMVSGSGAARAPPCFANLHTLSVSLSLEPTPSQLTTLRETLRDVLAARAPPGGLESSADNDVKPFDGLTVLDVLQVERSLMGESEDQAWYEANFNLMSPDTVLCPMTKW